MNGKMSLAEALNVGLSTTVIGLVIVFLVLIILMLVVMAMKYIFAKNPEKSGKTAPETIAVIPSVKADEYEENEEELIAILTAAVAASLNTSTYNLRIKSYRRIASNSNPWQKAGLNETISNRY